MSIKVIHCGKLIDGTGKPYRENFTIIIEDNIIKKVEKTQDVVIPKKSIIIDASNKIVLPGLIDSHVHFLAMGYRLGHYQVGHKISIGEIVSGLKKYIQINDISEGKWIQGRGWDDQNLKEKRYPNRYDLDVSSPKNPVALTRICGHMIVLNSIGLEICNINKDTANPPGGVIDKDDQGEPTGILRDARNLVRPYIPPPSYQELRQGIRDATKLAHSLGITTVHDASRPDESLPHLSTIPYFDAWKEKDLNIRAHVMTGLPRERTGEEWLSFGTLKIGVDGSMGAETALVYEPYTSNPSSRGVYVGNPQRDLNWIKEALEIGCQVAIHAIGDKAVNEAINLIEKTGDKLDKNKRYRIEHFEYPTDKDIERSKKIGIIASMQPNFVGEWGWPGGMYDTRLGKERLARSNPFNRLISDGFHVAFGSDGMPFHAVYGIWSAVNHPIPEHRITVEEAVRCYTYEGAYATKEESIKGTIEQGKLADIAILSTDITSQEFRLTTNNPEIIKKKIKEIKETNVNMTIQNGEIVYNNK